eukprot:196759_1
MKKIRKKERKKKGGNPNKLERKGRGKGNEFKLKTLKNIQKELRNRKGRGGGHLRVDPRHGKCNELGIPIKYINSDGKIATNDDGTPKFVKLTQETVKQFIRRGLVPQQSETYYIDYWNKWIDWLNTNCINTLSRDNLIDLIFCYFNNNDVAPNTQYKEYTA